MIRTIGSRVGKIVKNKIAPQSDAEFDIMYNHGISYEDDLPCLATKYNVACKSGFYV